MKLHKNISNSHSSTYAKSKVIEIKMDNIPLALLNIKYIFKNEILLYHQVQHSGLIGFQTLIPKVQHQRKHTHNSSHFFSNIRHLAQ